MNTRTKTRKTKRGPGWIGTRVTVCGYKLRTANDLICLLPPNHSTDIKHTSMGISDDGPVLAVEYPQYVEWSEVNHA